MGYGMLRPTGKPPEPLLTSCGRHLAGEESSAFTASNEECVSSPEEPSAPQPHTELCCVSLQARLLQVAAECSSAVGHLRQQKRRHRAPTISSIDIEIIR